MLARITGRSIPTEALSISTNYNLVRSIRIRKYKWLGMILRVTQDKFIYDALKMQEEMDSPTLCSNLLLDAPPISFTRRNH